MPAWAKSLVSSVWDRLWGTVERGGADGVCLCRLSQGQESLGILEGRSLRFLRQGLWRVSGGLVRGFPAALSDLGDGTVTLMGSRA